MAGSDVIYVRKDQTMCRDATFTDVGKFLIFNYIIHAFTVISYPGERASRSIGIAILALLVPGVGMERAASVIYQAPILLRNGPIGNEGHSYLQRISRWAQERIGRRTPGKGDYSEPLALAHAAGALCTIVREDEVTRMSLDDGDFVEDKLIHGRYKRSDREKLIRVPPHIPVKSVGNSGDLSALELSSNTSLLKSLVAICQLVYSAWEVYSARGNQFEKFGYASYALTTIPYALMSLVNFWAAVLSPQYPCLFLVDRETSDNHKKDETDTVEINNRIVGAVGVLDITPGSRLEKEPRFHPSKKPNRYLVHAVATYIGAAAYLAAPYVVISLLTGFQRRSSTHSQRVWIILWIVSGQLAAIGFLERLMPSYGQNTQKVFREVLRYIQWLSVVSSCISAVGGYVVVMQMINTFGVCGKL